MRLLIKLQASKDCAYDLRYYHKLQGFIYGLLRNTPYGILHDKKGYKFFCFSNVFPAGDMKKGEIRQLMVSSPDRVLIKTLKEELEKAKAAEVGEMAFEIEEVRPLQPELGEAAA